AERQQALAAIAKSEPRSAGAWRALGDAAMTRHDYPAALDAYQRARALDPENTDLLNEFAYAAAYTGHFDEGDAALRKYRELRPKDPNALDSLGDLRLMANRFHEAEDFYQQAYKLNPSFDNNGDLFKSAMARAMTGDIA